MVRGSACLKWKYVRAADILNINWKHFLGLGGSAEVLMDGELLLCLILWDRCLHYLDGVQGFWPGFDERVSKFAGNLETGCPNCSFTIRLHKIDRLNKVSKFKTGCSKATQTPLWLSPCWCSVCWGVFPARNLGNVLYGDISNTLATANISHSNIGLFLWLWFAENQKKTL